MASVIQLKQAMCQRGRATCTALGALLRPYWSQQRDFFYLFVFLVLFFGYKLGSYALQVPDEARYVEISREMLAWHEFLVPRLHGLLYLEKPPLIYWQEALAMATLGQTEWAVRFPIAAWAGLTVLLVYRCTRCVLNRAIAFSAALICATSTLFFMFAHVITPDMPLTCFMTMALLGLLLLIDPVSYAAHLAGRLLVIVGLGLGVMTKGLVACVLPLSSVIVWSIGYRDWRVCQRLCHATTVMGVLLLTAPWHCYMAIQVKPFFYFYFIEQHILRYVTKMAHHSAPHSFYLLVLILGLMPWTLFLPQALRACWRARHSPAKKVIVLLLIYTANTLLFFTCSASKLFVYILPVIPALSIVLAWYLSVDINVQALRRIVYRASGFLCLCASLMALCIYREQLIVQQPRALAYIVLVAMLVRTLLPLIRHKVILTIGLVSLTLPVYALVMDNLQGRISHSSKSLVQHYLSLRAQDAPLIIFRGNFYDAAWYANAVPMMVLPLKGEMRWPLAHDGSTKSLLATSHWQMYQTGRTTLLNDTTALLHFWRMQTQRVFILTYKDDLKQLQARAPFIVQAVSHDLVLASNY